MEKYQRVSNLLSFKKLFMLNITDTFVVSKRNTNLKSIFMNFNFIIWINCSFLIISENRNGRNKKK